MNWEEYEPHLLCVNLSESLIIKLTSFFSGASIEFLHDPANINTLISRSFFDLAILKEGSDTSFVIGNEAMETSVTLPAISAALREPDQLVKEAKEIMESDLSPDWSFFEATFPDDPHVVQLLKSEMKREFAYFEETFLLAFDKKDSKAIRKAIHRVKVVCEQLKLNSFLRAFYFCRLLNDFENSEPIKRRMNHILHALYARL